MSCCSCGSVCSCGTSLGACKLYPVFDEGPNTQSFIFCVAPHTSFGSGMGVEQMMMVLMIRVRVLLIRVLVLCTEQVLQL
ncbi:hypothetical protein MKX03_013992 [Papaver bracteatum]|nr:hypothetical protein MKX03_013992 [Papaver bracteatum]